MHGITSRASLFQSGNSVLNYVQGTLKQGILDTVNSGILDTVLFQVAYFKGYIAKVCFE